MVTKISYLLTTVKYLIFIRYLVSLPFESQTDNYFDMSVRIKKYTQHIYIL